MSVEEKPLIEDVLVTAAPAASAVTAATGTPTPEALALDRFRSCRWRKSPEDGVAECCAHRDVLPLTGANGFDAGAWCPDCGYYKLRRTPKKRDDFAYNY